MDLHEASTGVAPVFILAAPRSGGRRLARWLSGPRARLNPWLGAIDRARTARALPPRDRSDLWTRDDAVACSSWLQPLLAQEAQVAASMSFEYAPSSLLRVAALAEWFPGARFIFLYRDVRETLALMLDGWLASVQPHPSGVQLPDATRWNYPLPPGWSAQCSRPVAEIVAWQWARLVGIGLDMLMGMATPRFCVTSYDRLLDDPSGEFQRISGFLGGPGSRLPEPIDRFLPNDRSSPDAAVWQHHAEPLRAMVPIVAEQADRAVRLFAHAPQTRVVHKRARIAGVESP